MYIIVHIVGKGNNEDVKVSINPFTKWYKKDNEYVTVTNVNLEII